MLVQGVGAIPQPCSDSTLQKPSLTLLPSSTPNFIPVVGDEAIKALKKEVSELRRANGSSRRPRLSFAAEFDRPRRF